MSSPVSGIAELVLESTDLPAMTRFYHEVVGLEILGRAKDRVWLSAGRACRLGVWSPGLKEHGDEGGRHVHFALSAAPGMLDVVARRLDGHGVAVEGPTAHDGGDRSIYFRDPENNLVEMWDFFQRGNGARYGTDVLR